MTNPFANAGTATQTAPQGNPFGGQQTTPPPPPQTNGYTKADQFADAPSTNPAPAAGGDPFSDPSGPGDGRVSNLVGRLVLCRPTELETNVVTSQGVADRVIRAKVAVLDGPEPGKIYDSMRIFQKPLVRDLVAILEDPAKALLIGRIARGNTTRTPDKAPYIFARATDEDKALATQFLSAVGHF